MIDGVIALAVLGTGARSGTGTRTTGAIVVASVPVQVHCKRFFIKPYNSFVHVSIPGPDRASKIKP